MRSAQLLSHENWRFEHELTWLALKNMIRGPSLSEKDRHLCMRDERLWRDTCQNFPSRASNVVFFVPSFRSLRMERLGP